ncbi:MAG: hypoxanthine phosphoribosyltransferase [Verrucomicrobiota bacterium]
MPLEDDQSSPSEELDKIIVDEATIRDRIHELGAEITSTYEGREIAIIAITNGAVVFVADLIRQIKLSLQLDCVRVSTYSDEADRAPSPEIIDRIRLNLEGIDVLLIDDILDTGSTLLKINHEIRKMKPASLRTCVLLDKQTPRSVHFEADFIGFQIPDEFVVGYGLDFAQRYRHLPHIGVLKPELQNPPQWG